MDEKVKKRFLRYIDKTDSCWLWNGIPSKCGYAYFKINNKSYLAHRVSWLIAGNTIPDDKPYLRHKCKSKICVNPDHLEIGTHAENMSDKIRDGTIVRGEKVNTAKLTEEQVLQIRQKIQNGETQVKVAKDFDISRRNIRSIILRESWKHI